jgi:hypothetical protein
VETGGKEPFPREERPETCSWFGSTVASPSSPPLHFHFVPPSCRLFSLCHHFYTENFECGSTQRGARAPLNSTNMDLRHRISCFEHIPMMGGDTRSLYTTYYLLHLPTIAWLTSPSLEVLVCRHTPISWFPVTVTPRVLPTDDSAARILEFTESPDHRSLSIVLQNDTCCTDKIPMTWIPMRGYDVAAELFPGSPR